MSQFDREVRRRLSVLAHARQTGNVSKTCRFFGISRDTYYEWRRAHRTGGVAALHPRKRGPNASRQRATRPRLYRPLHSTTHGQCLRRTAADALGVQPSDGPVNASVDAKRDQPVDA